jgi:hypothetical protein
VSWSHNLYAEFEKHSTRVIIANLTASDITRGMRSTIHFNIWQEDGMYVAAAVGVPVVPEGATFEELQENIRGVVQRKWTLF